MALAAPPFLTVPNDMCVYAYDESPGYLEDIEISNHGESPCSNRPHFG
jgi:hypothetical protein